MFGLLNTLAIANEPWRPSVFLFAFTLYFFLRELELGCIAYKMGFNEFWGSGVSVGKND
jgi:hypothetical protein